MRASNKKFRYFVANLKLEYSRILFAIFWAKKGFVLSYTPFATLGQGHRYASEDDADEKIMMVEQWKVGGVRADQANTQTLKQHMMMVMMMTMIKRIMIIMIIIMIIMIMLTTMFMMFMTMIKTSSDTHCKPLD